MPSAGSRRIRCVILRIAVAVALAALVGAALLLRGAGRYLVVDHHARTSGRDSRARRLRASNDGSKRSISIVPAGAPHRAQPGTNLAAELRLRERGFGSG